MKQKIFKSWVCFVEYNLHSYNLDRIYHSGFLLTEIELFVVTLLTYRPVLSDLNSLHKADYSLCAKLFQSCPTLRPYGLLSLQVSSLHGIFYARILECLPCPSYSGDLSQPRDWEPGPLYYFLHWQVGSLPLTSPEKLIL